MANRNIIPWDKGFPPAELTPQIKDAMETHVAVFSTIYTPDLNSGNIIDGDWMPSEPIPTDIHSDFIITAERLTGSADLPIEIEGALDPFMKNKTGTSGWESMTGQDLVWKISGGVNPTPGMDWVKVDIAEIGVMPYIRLAYKNSTGSTQTVAWRVTVNFDRGV